MADNERLVFHLSSGGDVVIKLRPDLAPGHVERIKRARQQRLLRRRAFPPRDPGLHGAGRRPDRAPAPAARTSPNLKAEFSREPHVRGVASMARTQDPNSANSQFFICFDDARFLDSQYTVWGEVERAWNMSTPCRRASRRASPGKIEKAEIQAVG